MLWVCPGESQARDLLAQRSREADEQHGHGKASCGAGILALPGPKWGEAWSSVASWMLISKLPLNP